MGRKTKEGASGPLYLVQRLAWSVSTSFRGDAVHYVRSREDGGVAVAAFADRDRAEAHAAQLEAEARRELSPFLFAYPDEMEAITSKPAGEWSRRLKQVGLKPPTKARFPDDSGAIHWQKWYDSVLPDLTDEQRRAIWDLCDRLKLYEVVRLEADGPA